MDATYFLLDEAQEQADLSSIEKIEREIAAERDARLERGLESIRSLRAALRQERITKDTYDRREALCFKAYPGLKDQIESAARALV